jgi:hypothetical protein
MMRIERCTAVGYLSNALEASEGYAGLSSLRPP